MKIYLVGGAVRDKLLGLPIKERDWVVVGATVAEMQQLGYRQVGKEFPVFLHPKTNEEYALARVERKVEPGYTGFTFDTSPEVTLEEDLQRRDLTINAMAETEEGRLIDPYQGQQDLAKKVLRHVSPAFAEDPVRILRVGRFLARYAHLGFHVAPETLEVMRAMVTAGEVDALVAERVWKELERALGEKNPEEFFAVLAQCQALPVLFPNLRMDDAGLKALHAAALFSNLKMDDAGSKALNAAARLTDHTLVRFAALLHALPEPKQSLTALCERYRVPNQYRELALLTALHYEQALRAKTLSAAQLLQLFSSTDVFRRAPRFANFLLACEAIAQSKGISFNAHWLNECAQVALTYNVQELIAQGLVGMALAAKLQEKRLEKIAAWLLMQ